MPVLTLRALEDAIRHSWARDTCDPTDVEVWSTTNPARGQCPVTALVVHDLLGGQLLEAEVQERAERRERRRLLDARFPLINRLEDFRFADSPKVPQATIAALAEGSWIDDRESVILIGESGTGKTMLATALGVCACQQGRRVRFTTLAGLATELQEADSRKELGRVVGRYARTEVVVLDEMGYLALPDGAAELVFQALDGARQRRLGDVALLGRAGKIQRFAERDEVADLAELHG